VNCSSILLFIAISFQIQEVGDFFVMTDVLNVFSKRSVIILPTFLDIISNNIIVVIHDSGCGYIDFILSMKQVT